jgi:hypothetical protein
MIEPKHARRLLRICASARQARFNGIKAVSVAKRDLKRADVAAIIGATKPLWEPGSCLMGMQAWVQFRRWFPLVQPGLEPK